jgi:hydroxymethylglutaryl-CoA lyase
VSRPITIVEVGPRDGLQNETTILDPAVRADLVNRLEAAGARRIEAVSFVHPKYVPQMAGAEAVMAALPHAAGRSRIGLVLNGKGYDRALGTAVDEVNVAMSATDGFGLKNQGLSVDQQVQMLADIIAGRANAAPPPPSAVPLPLSGRGNGQPGATPSLSATLSCVWGCPFDGEVSDGQVADLVGRIAALGVTEIALADTGRRPATAFPRHPQHRPGQCLCRDRGGGQCAGRLGRRHRRLSVRARRHGQYRH